MIKKQNELLHENVKDLKKGSGIIRMVHLLTEKEMQGKGRLFALNVVPPKGSIGLHRHSGDFETYYILKGKAEVSDGKYSYEVGSGDVTVCENGKKHSISNIGEDDPEYVALILYSDTEKEEDTADRRC